MEDAEIVGHIHQLVGDYRDLERQHGGLGLTPDQRKTLGELQAEIDQSWDLLRRRRAKRNMGEDPDGPLTGPRRPTRAPRASKARNTSA